MKKKIFDVMFRSAYRPDAVVVHHEKKSSKFQQFIDEFQISPRLDLIRFPFTRNEEITCTILRCFRLSLA